MKARAALVAVTTAVLSSATAGAQQLSMDLIFDERTEQHPRSVSFSPSGDRLAYLWDDGEGRGMWLLDVESGDSTLAFRIGDLADQMEGAGLDAYLWFPPGDALLIEFGGDLMRLDLAAGSLRRLTSTDETETDPKLSPEGDRVAFVRGQDLYLIDVESGEETRLTQGGEANVLLNGLTDWVYWEELWGRDSTGFWWSPDGGRIAYYQFDETPVPEYSLVDFQSHYPDVEWQKYPKAGEANPLVRVGVLDLASGETTWMQTGDQVDWYLPRVDWTPDGGLTVQRLNRDQDRLDLLRCDPSNGECSTWVSEASETWLDVTDDYRFLPDGRLVWPSERSGWNQLYLINSSGDTVAQLTDAGGSVTSLVGITSDEAVVYQAYAGPPLGALSRQIHRTGLEDGGSDLVSPESGWSSALLAPGSGALLLTSSSSIDPTTRTVLDSAGETIARLPYEAPVFDHAALPQREFFTIRDAQGRELPASIIRPAGFDEKRIYPAIMYHYGGPESQVLLDLWNTGSRELWSRMMAERGFVMFSVDNPGSNFFGQRGADALHRRFGEVNLAAQKAGVEYLRSQPWIDGERIGLWGWSGGGANTLYSVLNSPGTWRAAVAGAPVTDWRLYDTIWTERYLDHPADNPDGYRDSSAVTWADQLSDALLMVHGTADDNVHPQNSLVMTKALVDAGAQFDWAIYPRQKHGFRGNASRHFYEKMTAFFDRHLGGPSIGDDSKEPRG